MSDWFDPFDDDDEFGESETEDETSAVRLLARLARLAASLPWFERIGEPLSKRDREFAEAHAAGLGFPDADVVRVADWQEAADACTTIDWDTGAWDAGEQLRAGLTAAACQRFGEDFVSEALQDVTGYAATHVQEALERAGELWSVRDEALLTAATGAAIRALHNAALVLLAGAGDDHALALEYRLFEMGRWPIALTGRTFHLF